jgi:hypothetical protein
MIEWKDYKKVQEQDFKCTIHYNKGKDYLLVVIPVKITKKEGFSIEEYGAFTGFKQSLLEVERKSKKNLKKAIELAKPLIDEMITKILNN